MEHPGMWHIEAKNAKCGILWNIWNIWEFEMYESLWKAREYRIYAKVRKCKIRKWSNLHQCPIGVYTVFSTSQFWRKQLAICFVHKFTKDKWFCRKIWFSNFRETLQISHHFRETHKNSKCSIPCQIQWHVDGILIILILFALFALAVNWTLSPYFHKFPYNWYFPTFRILHNTPHFFLYFRSNVRHATSALFSQWKWSPICSISLISMKIEKPHPRRGPAVVPAGIPRNPGMAPNTVNSKNNSKKHSSLP